MIFDMLVCYKINWGRGGDGTTSPFLFQIRSIGLQYLDSCIYIVVTAPLPSPQNLILSFRGETISLLIQLKVSAA